jgi:hypothetical protein
MEPITLQYALLTAITALSGVVGYLFKLAHFDLKAKMDKCEEEREKERDECIERTDKLRDEHEKRMDSMQAKYETQWQTFLDFKRSNGH